MAGFRIRHPEGVYEYAFDEASVSKRRMFKGEAIPFAALEQAGFAMVAWAKNAGNIIMKNLMDFALSSLVFWALGFGLMQGASIGGWIGMPDLFIRGNYGPGTIPTSTFVIFQTMFAATIVSGSMAERTKFISNCIYLVVITALIYPVSGHWIWGGGWLAQLCFHESATE